MFRVADPTIDPHLPNRQTRVIPLHLLLFHANNRWYAECLDLDLITTRESGFAAFRELLVQINLYLETADGSGEWDKYYPRRAPTSHWMRYYVASLFQELRGLLFKRAGNLTYRMPFDACGRPISA
jgi:hypothetical protein